MPFQVLAGLVLVWHSRINWIKLAHLNSFPHIAWKEKRGIAWKGKINGPSEAASHSMKLFPGQTCRQPPGHCRDRCLGIGEAACPPSFPASSSHVPPHRVPHVCHHVAPPAAEQPPPWLITSGLGATFTVGDTWDLSDVVMQSPQPAWGVPCSNILLELSCVCRLIRNTRIPETVKTEGCGDSWVPFTFYIRSSCYLLCRLFFLN